MSVDHRGAWSDFWAQNSGGGQGSGCLPDGYRQIDAAQQSAWRSFAQSLPKSARVLDVATGDARVMRWMQSVRRDLKLVGVDLAERLPDPPRGAKVRAGVAMERLPFPDRRFAAIVSQFGFEYGDLPRAAAEFARVLRDDGKIALITHRQDGPILAHNLARRKQIQWAIDQQDLPTKAKQSLAMRRVGLATVPPVIAEAPARGAAGFGQRSAAWEIAEAIRQCLVLGQRDAPANVAQLIDSVATKARNELARIASLEAACAQTADEQGFAAALAEANLVERERRSLVERQGQQPFADYRLIVRV